MFLKSSINTRVQHWSLASNLKFKFDPAVRKILWKFERVIFVHIILISGNLKTLENRPSRLTKCSAENSRQNLFTARSKSKINLLSQFLAENTSFVNYFLLSLEKSLPIHLKTGKISFKSSLYHEIVLIKKKVPIDKTT